MHIHPPTGCVGFRHMHFPGEHSPYWHPLSCGRCRCFSAMRAHVAPCQPWCSHGEESPVRWHLGVPGHHPWGCTYALVGPWSLPSSLQCPRGGCSGWPGQGGDAMGWLLAAPKWVFAVALSLHCSLSPCPSCCCRFSCLCPPFKLTPLSLKSLWNSTVAAQGAGGTFLFNMIGFGQMPSQVVLGALFTPPVYTHFSVPTAMLHRPFWIMERLDYVSHPEKHRREIIRWPHDTWSRSVRCTSFSFLPAVYSHTSITASVVKPTLPASHNCLHDEPRQCKEAWLPLLWTKRQRYLQRPLPLILDP